MQTISSRHTENLPRSWGWRPECVRMQTQSPTPYTLSSRCSGFGCQENHLKKKPNHHRSVQLAGSWVLEPKKKANGSVKRHKLTLWSLVNQASEALGSRGVWERVAAGAAHLLQLWQQFLYLRHLHLDDMHNPQNAASVTDAKLLFFFFFFSLRIFRKAELSVRVETHTAR